MVWWNPLSWFGQQSSLEDPDRDLEIGIVQVETEEVVNIPIVQEETEEKVITVNNSSQRKIRRSKSYGDVNRYQPYSNRRSKKLPHPSIKTHYASTRHYQRAQSINN